MTLAATTSASRHPRVTYLVKRLEMAVRSNLDQLTSELDISTPHYAALSSLLQKPGMTSAELARVSFVSAQAAHQMINVMERKGLVRREVSPHHRKELQIFLTDHGRECLRQCDERVEQVENLMFASLSPEEQHILADLLARCSRALLGARRG